MLPYTTEEVNWLSSGPTLPAAAIPAAITRARRQWLWQRAAAAVDLAARLAATIRRSAR
jgi:hypothetical protein